MKIAKYNWQFAGEHLTLCHHTISAHIEKHSARIFENWTEWRIIINGKKSGHKGTRREAIFAAEQLIDEVKAQPKPAKVPDFDRGDRIVGDMIARQNARVEGKR